jgi:hypothetical protein
MPYDFPDSPTNGQTVTMPDGSTRVWDGTKWKAGPGTGTGGISDAPSDSTYYGRENGAWQHVLGLIGGTMTGAIAMGSNKITGLANGTAPGDAAAFGQVHPIPAGGTTGQSLTKNSATDYDVGWSTVSGGGVSGLAASQVLFGSATGTIAQDAQLAWNTTSKILSLGVSPTLLRIQKDPTDLAIDFNLNASWTGTAWAFDDTTKDALSIDMDQTLHQVAFSWAPASANPPVWKVLLTLGSTTATLGTPLAMGANKITGLANGTGATDAAAFGQIPTVAGVYLPLAGGTMSGAIAMGTNKITGIGNGSAAQDAVAFGQVPVASSTTPVMDGAAAVGSGTTWARADHVHPSDTSRVALAGGTMTGLLVLSANPAAALGAATKQYVDAYFPVAAANAGVPTGGTAGQVLTKNTATNYDVAWTAPSGGVSGLTAKQILFGATGGTIAQDAQLLWDATVKELVVSPTQTAGYDTHVQQGAFYVNVNASLVPTTTTKDGLQFGMDTGGATGTFFWNQASQPLPNPVVWTQLAALNKNAFNVTVPYQYKGTNFTQYAHRQGSGNGTDYSTTSGTYVWVDTSNLQVTVTIPTGFTALVWATGTMSVSTASTGVVAVSDGTPANLVGTSQLVFGTAWVSFCAMGRVTGDGASHTFGLAYASGGGGPSIKLWNQSYGQVQMRTLILPMFTTL